MEDAGLARLLEDRGARSMAHPGGSLGAHLERVEQRLAELGLSRTVQLAGRAHAVYGTDGFDVPLLDPSERPLLAGIVGAEAEALVHRYAVCDRRRTWPELAGSLRVHDRHTGEVHHLSPEEARDLADLSLVNEIDVAEHAEGFVEQHGGYFRQLTSSWAGILSPSVLAVAEHTFG